MTVHKVHRIIGFSTRRFHVCTNLRCLWSRGVSSCFSRFVLLCSKIHIIRFICSHSNEHATVSNTIGKVDAPCITVVRYHSPALPRCCHPHRSVNHDVCSNCSDRGAEARTSAGSCSFNRRCEESCLLHSPDHNPTLLY